MPGRRRIWRPKAKPRTFYKPCSPRFGGIWTWVVKSMGATPLDIFRRVPLPGALPTLISGLNAKAIQFQTD